MQRIRTVMRGLVNKSKNVEVSAEALAAISTVCKIAATVSVPGLQTACTAIQELITMVETAKSNDEQWKRLLQYITDYVTAVEDFARAISNGKPEDYIAQSTDLKATYAREAIADFAKSISSTKAKVEERLKDGRIRKKLGASAIKGDIEGCRQDLTACLERFKLRTGNILHIQEPTQAVAEVDDLIPGAKSIAAGDFETLEDVDFETCANANPFWNNLVRVEVGNTVRVAKMYSSKVAEDEFKEHMKFFSETWGPRIARIYRYNTTSQTPVLIFTQKSIRPLLEHLRDLSRKDQQNFIITGWRLFKDMGKASRYLCTDTNWAGTFIRRCLRNAAVGADGQLIMAPPNDNFLRRRGLLKSDTVEIGIEQVWGRWLLDKYDELRFRWIRPISLALEGNAKAFLEHPIDDLESPAEAFKAIQQYWRPIRDRPFRIWSDAFPSDVMPGDVGILSVSKNPPITFRRLANITDLVGDLHWYPPGKPTEVPNVYRQTFYVPTYEDTRAPDPLRLHLQYIISPETLKTAALARQLKILGDRHGVPPSSLAIVIAVRYNLQSLTSHRPLLEELLATGRTLHLYIYYSPERRFLSSQWSFHDSPPTEAEVAAEASTLKAFPCPEMQFCQLKMSSLSCRQLEDSDIERYLQGSENEDGAEQAEITGESSRGTAGIDVAPTS